jgi:glucokinase
MPDAFRTVGIDIGGTAIKIAVLWNDGRVVTARQIPTHPDAGPERAVERLLVTVRELMAGEGLEPGEMRAVGMDSAGIVDGVRNLVLDAPNLRSWERYPVAERLGAALGLPVFLENDVNAMAYGEWSCGAGRGTRHLLCLTLGTGVGGGLILDGKLYRGSSGAAGEVGHVSVQRDGPRCPCGSYGCLERYIGAGYIVERALLRLQRDNTPSSLRGVLPEEMTPLVISRAAAQGDELAAEVLEETGIWLGVALAGLVNVLNPERIVVGGGVAQAGEWILGPARRSLRERAMSLPGEAAEIVPAALGNDASVVGAALLGLERVRES